MSVIVFGSFARGEAGPDSDTDVVAVRPAEIDEEVDAWTDSIEAWRREVHGLAGAAVEVRWLDPLARRGGVVLEVEAFTDRPRAVRDCY